MKVNKYVLMMLFFLLGLLMGIQMQKIFLKNYLHHSSKKKPDVLVRKLDKQLDLSAEQEKKAGDIFSSSFKQCKQIKEKCLPQYERILEKAYDDFGKILNIDQQKKFTELREKFKKKYEKWEKKKKGCSD